MVRLNPKRDRKFRGFCCFFWHYLFFICAGKETARSVVPPDGRDSQCVDGICEP